MAEMAAAATARHGRANHAEGAVLALVDRMLQRRPEARPTGAAFEFGLRRIKRQIAAGAAEGAVAMLIEKRAGERPLGALPAQHVKLLRRQKLAPFVVAVRHFVNTALGAGDMRSRHAQNGERGG